MPYCPKCDMEFIDGITVCSDCGGPLLSSPEEAKAIREAQEQKALEEFLAQFREEASEDELSESDFAEKTDLSAETDLSEEAQISEDRDISGEPTSPSAGKRTSPAPSAGKTTGKGIPELTSVYVRKSDRCQDMNSSASAFLIVGCAAFLLAVFTFTGILPFAGSGRFTFAGVFGVMGIACMVVCVKSKKEAAVLKGEAEKENQEMEETISWFIEAHPAAQLTQKLAREQAESGQSYSPEEESLKLFELIQDYLIIEKDLPDQSYVDALSEEIYHRLFE